MNKMYKDIVYVVAVSVFWLLVLIFAPILTMLALNQLFGLGIVITIWSWLSMVWVQIVTFGGVMTAIKNLGKKL